MNNRPETGHLYCFKPECGEDIVWLSVASKKGGILILKKDYTGVFLLTKIDNNVSNKRWNTFYFLLNTETYKLVNVSIKTFNLYFKEIKNEI